MNSRKRDVILVIEDTEANRYVLTHLLRKAGYDVIEADSLAAAEDRLNLKPDLIICDVNLPDGKGTAFAQRIKSSPATESIMVLNMSASFTRTRDRVEGLERGADGYLVQPVDPSEFLATVASLLRIRHAEEKVRRKNEDLELVSHAISHDLQEPMRMIVCYIDIIRRPGSAKLDDHQSRAFDQVRASAIRMRSLVTDLISLTLADHGRSKRVPFDLRAAVDDALANLSVMVQQNNPILTIDPLPRILGDRGLMTQVFQNLLSNAMKYRSDRPLTIAITTEKADHHVSISVRDNGIGIPPASCEGVFTAFTRLHSHQEIPGSGIGLALCKKIVELHDGHIGCTSEVGVGSVFSFSVIPAD
jgi:signal transduction histidine kinase